MFQPVLYSTYRILGLSSKQKTDYKNECSHQHPFFGLNFNFYFHKRNVKDY